MKKKQNIVERNWITALNIMGYLFLTAVLWTIPLDIRNLIAATFSPQTHSESDWIYTLFIWTSLVLGTVILVFVDALKKRNIANSALKWFVVMCAIYYIFVMATLVLT